MYGYKTTGSAFLSGSLLALFSLEKLFQKFCNCFNTALQLKKDKTTNWYKNFIMDIDLVMKTSCPSKAQTRAYGKTWKFSVVYKICNQCSALKITIQEEWWTDPAVGLFDLKCLSIPFFRGYKNVFKHFFSACREFVTYKETLEEEWRKRDRCIRIILSMLLPASRWSL